LAELTVDNPNLRITYRIIRPNGGVTWLERNSHAYFNEHGKIERIVGMIVDVTERKRAEEELAGVNRKLIEAQEQERVRIARELHDDIAQRLVLLTVQLEELQQNVNDSKSDIPARVGAIQERAVQIGIDVQAMSHKLHSSKLEYLGLVAAMQGFCKEFGEQQRVEIDFRNSDVAKHLSPEISLCLFRVLQEALHNGAKHSGVQHLEVQLQEDESGVNLHINDSGRGFDVNEAMHGRGLGLISMRERVRLVHGTITIDSSPMRGTHIHVHVPVASEDSNEHTAI
jgi:signal transduction histidine kinase